MLITSILLLLLILNLLPLKLIICFSSKKRFLRFYFCVLFFKKSIKFSPSPPKIKLGKEFILDIIRSARIKELHLDTVIGTGDAFESALLTQSLRNTVAAVISGLSYRFCKKAIAVSIMPDFEKEHFTTELELSLRLFGFGIVFSVIKSIIKGNLIKKGV